MPRINILKVDKHKCEHCGGEISDSVHCEITTATNKVIKMHQFCAIDFAVEILKEFSKDKDLREEVDRKLVEFNNSLEDNNTSQENEEEKRYSIINHSTCWNCKNYYALHDMFPHCNDPHCAIRESLESRL